MHVPIIFFRIWKIIYTSNYENVKIAKKPKTKRKKIIIKKGIFLYFLEKGVSFHLNKPKHAPFQIWLKLAHSSEEEDFKNFVNIFSLFQNYLPLEKGLALHLNKLEFPLPKHALFQIWLKFAMRICCKEDSKTLSMYFRYFVIISLWKKAWPFIELTWFPNYLCANMPCAKCGCNWSISSAEEDFFIPSTCCRYSVFISKMLKLFIVSIWKRVWYFIWINLIPFFQRCFLPLVQ